MDRKPKTVSCVEQANVKRTLRMTTLRRERKMLTLFKYASLLVSAIVSVNWLLVRNDAQIWFRLAGGFLGSIGIFGVFAVLSENVLLLQGLFTLAAIGHLVGAFLPLIILHLFDRESLLDNWCTHGYVTPTEREECRKQMSDSLSVHVAARATFMVLMGILMCAVLYRYMHIINLVNAEHARLASLEYDMENPRFTEYKEVDLSIDCDDINIETDIDAMDDFKSSCPTPNNCCSSLWYGDTGTLSPFPQQTANARVTPTNVRKRGDLAWDMA